ncbi:MAG: hypothetical protein ACR2QK_25310 [Acidimicrobiales bacterium]
MMQLVLSVILMYTTVAAAAIWYRRHVPPKTGPVSAADNTRTEGAN